MVASNARGATSALRARKRSRSRGVSLVPSACSGRLAENSRWRRSTSSTRARLSRPSSFSSELSSDTCGVTCGRASRATAATTARSLSGSTGISPRFMSRASVHSRFQGEIQMHVRIAASVLGLLLPFFAVAADDGELWEVTTQMNIPGMPAGMAGMCRGAQRVFGGKGPDEEAKRRPDMQKCKVVDLKQTATRMTLTMSCPDGQAVIDQTYNAARTEYKGTMTMKSKDCDMVINTAGRKVGTCDVQQARQQRVEERAKMKAQSKAQVAAMNQQQAAQRAKTTEAVAAACGTAASGMDASKFPDCLRPGSPMAKSATCTDPRLTEYTFPAAARASCDTKKAEYCQKFQTEAGFVQAVAADRRTQLDGAEGCGLKRAPVQSKLCQGAVQRESLDFLAGQCPRRTAEY